MRKTITVAVAAAAIAAAAGGAAAAASTHSQAVTGTEHFQAMSMNATASTTSVIGYGVFTGVAVDHEQAHNMDTFVFPNGTVRVHHDNGKGEQSFNPKTCLMNISQQGAYQITGGTGSYAGITGHGRYTLEILGVAARGKGGKCSQSKPPVAFHQVINASGPVTLK